MKIKKDKPIKYRFVLLSGVVGSSNEPQPLISLLAFFERLKNNDEFSEKQTVVRPDEGYINTPNNKLIEEPKPKRRKGLCH